jgi:DNA polymerase III epsilon subunit-like protein
MGNFATVIIDFETTGLSPGMGDRSIEVGAVFVQNNQILDRFQSLMNPGMRISLFIEEYTGITNRMLSTAPPVQDVMRNLAKFILQHHLVAHNSWSSIPASKVFPMLSSGATKTGTNDRRECTMIPEKLREIPQKGGIK